jgi:hypothetical protein
VALSNAIRGAGLVLAAQLLLSLAPAAAGAGESCEVGQRRGPVFLLILQSNFKVHEFAATVRGARVVRQDPATVIFSDGRVVTANVDSATQHLNALNWGRRPIEVVASFPAARTVRRRAVG